MIELVEASAGTGKTHRISQRFVSLVAEDGLRVDEILTVTFTNSATAELKKRIREALRAARAVETDPERRDRLRQALLDFDAAAISTIHGFTQRALSEHPLSSGIEPSLSFETDVASLVDAFVRDAWVSATCDLDPEHLTGLKNAGFKPVAMRTAALARLNAPRALIRPASSPLLPRIDRPAVIDAARVAWAAHRNDLLRHLRGHMPRLNRNYSQDDKLLDCFAEIDGWLADPAGDPPDVLCLETICKQIRVKNRLPLLSRDDLEHPGIEAVDALCAAFATERGANRHEAQQRILQAVTDVEGRLPIHRRRHHTLTYGELLTILADASTGELADVLRSRFKAALIDEFQDTDPVQWAIFRGIFGSGLPLVLVGDEKQAIYAFRGADVHAFRRARSEVASSTTLEANHRSDAPLLDAFNLLFPRLRFPPVTPVHPSRLSVGPPLEIRFLPRTSPEGKRNLVDVDRDRIASWLAVDVERLLASAPTLSRRDVAVLVHTHRDGERIQEALRARGIASVRHSQSDVLLSSEAGELARLLAAVLEPQRRARVGTALAGSLLGLSSAELWACHADDAQWDAHVADLRRWAASWHEGGISAAWQAISADGGVFPRLLATPTGARSAANLRHLVEWLHGAERSRRLGPVALLRHLQAARVGAVPPRGEEERDGPDDRLLRLESDGDAVQIATIYAAKGLQFPVVFCPSLWRRDNVWASDRDALRHVDGGETVLDLTLKKASDHPALVAAQGEKDEEGNRLLYVAMTRAEHRCVVYWGSFSGSEDSPLSEMLHARPGETRADVAPRVKGMSDAEILEELQALAASLPDAIGVRTAEGDPPPPAPAPEAVAADLPYLPWSGRRLDTRWRLSSFTGLAGSGSPVLPEAEGVDRDRDAEDPPARWEDHGDDCDPLCRLSPGMKAGNCLHAILEGFDLEATGSQLRHHGFDEALAPDVTAGLRRALDTPLPGLGASLSEVAPADRVTELPFHLRLGVGVPRSRIAAVLREHGASLPPGYADRFGRPDQAPLDGLMKGSIDLVFRRDERWYLADWKSTWLGHTADRYTATALRASMVHHDYFLQLLIYGVALHRFLEKRVQDYFFERHFGGSYYLYVRGMTPGATTGIVYDPLTGPLIPALADLVSPR